MKKAIINDPLFRQKYLLTFGKMDEINEFLMSKKIELVQNERWGAFSGLLPSGVHHLHFECYGFSAIVHETNHAALDTLNARGIKINQETKEVFAYYQDWLAGRCRDYLEKWSNPT